MWVFKIFDLQILFLQESSADRAERIFYALDENGDGTVTEDEFVVGECKDVVSIFCSLRADSILGEGQNRWGITHKIRNILRGDHTLSNPRFIWIFFVSKKNNGFIFNERFREFEQFDFGKAFDDFWVLYLL